MRRSTPRTIYRTWNLRFSRIQHERAQLRPAAVLISPRPHRHPDPARRGLLKRMRCQIDLSEQGQIDGPDGISQRLLVTSVLVCYGLEVDPHAMRADYLRSMLKAGIELVRSSRLTQVESLCAHPISNSELLILSRNIAGEDRDCN